jgi:hypothetical protein
MAAFPSSDESEQGAVEEDHDALSLDEKLELFDHLDQCEVCREAIYLLARDRDTALFSCRPATVGPDRMAS